METKQSGTNKPGSGIHFLIDNDKLLTLIIFQHYINCYVFIGLCKSIGPRPRVLDMV